jgi:hypothetical protein
VDSVRFADLLMLVGSGPVIKLMRHPKGIELIGEVLRKEKNSENYSALIKSIRKQLAKRK